MPSALTAIRRIPWKRVWITAIWLYNQGRNRLEQNLTAKEREELWGLMKRSKGVPTNLSKRQRERFGELVNRAVRGRSASLEAAARPSSACTSSRRR